MRKAPEEPPDPTDSAPALDPTDERRLETELRRGVRHRHRRKPPGTATPSAYRHRASRRLYTNVVGTLKTTKLYDRTADTITVDEIERIVI